MCWRRSRCARRCISVRRSRAAPFELDSDDRVVVLVAHPDDEAYAHGALLARARTCGATTHVLCLTRGEGGRPRASVDARRQLAERREAELRAACVAVGATPSLLGVADGAVKNDEATCELIRRLLEQLQPTVLLTCGDDGVYGHRDHLASLQLARALCGVLGDRAPHHLVACFPRGLFTPLWRRLRRSPFIDPAIRVSDLGVEPDGQVFRLDLDEAERRVKRQMLSCHGSQLRDSDPQRFLLPEIAAWVLKHEWYREGSRAHL
ncbi:MAG: hypothetical protein CSA65_00010 [Proteobacteria bacterium]|nr:MAG: hypothetical protein CSA65_00010 [Pseudomonadota bacterium]